MKYCFNLAGISLCLDSERSLIVEEDWKLFQDRSGTIPDIQITVSWEWKKEREHYGKLLGKDLIHQYYEEPPYYFCVSTEGKKGASMVVSYSNNFQKMICRINEADFLHPPDSVGRIMRALPLRSIFLKHVTVLFHGAQIFYKGCGIIFSAPSGTGKTTQAKLWENHKGAKILCSDRTLVKKTEKGYRTYGMPLDGSDPVCSALSCDLGAVVMLLRGKNNILYRLTSVEATAKMMEQMVTDWWDQKAQIKTIEFLLEMSEQIPVYQFFCTPDQEAVDILCKRLQKEGVIINENDF